MIFQKHLNIVWVLSICAILFSAIIIPIQIIRLNSSNTSDMVAAVVQSQKKPISNILTPITNLSCYTFNIDMDKGDRNYSVEALQRLLKLPSISSLVPIDIYKKNDARFDLIGFFGKETKSLVMNFQRQYNIRPSGRVDADTRTKLNSLYGCKTVQSSVATPIRLPARMKKDAQPLSTSNILPTIKSQNASPNTVTPINGYRIVVRHYTVDETTTYHPLIRCPRVGLGTGGFITKLVQFIVPSTAQAVVLCNDSDSSEIQRGNYDNTSRTGSTDSFYYPYITSHRYTKSRNGCYYNSDKSVHDNTYDSTFPGNTTYTCPEPGSTVPTAVPYSSQQQRKGGGQSVWSLLGPDPTNPQNTIPVTQITDAIQEDSRTDLIIDGGDPSATYVTSIPVIADGIYPASQQGPDDVLVNGWFKKPINCNQFTHAPGQSIDWNHDDPYTCYLRYAVNGNSITDVTPSVNAPYYAYGLGYPVSIVPANPTPSITSGHVSIKNFMLADVLTAFMGQNVTYTGSNFPTDGTAVVLLSGNGDMYQITPTVSSDSQFSFVIPNNLAAGTYSVQIRGDSTATSNTVSLIVSAISEKIIPERVAVNSGSTAMMTFAVPQGVINTMLYMYCPAGLTITLGANGNVCNTWLPLSLPASSLNQMQFVTQNTSGAVLKAVPNFYVYYPSNPNYANGVSGEITVSP